jgi:hypothetical protein
MNGEIKGMGWLQDAEFEMSDEPIVSYYQLCSLKGIDRKHLVRRFIFKNPGKFLKVETYKIDPFIYPLFKKKLLLKAYKEFNVYDLDEIALPTYGECLMVKMSNPPILTQSLKVNPHINYSSFKIFPSDY